MKSVIESVRDLVLQGRGLADHAWSAWGPGSGAFLSNERDLAVFPSESLEALEEERGKHFTPEEIALLEQGYRERVAELLERHIEAARKVLERLRGADGAERPRRL